MLTHISTRRDFLEEKSYELGINYFDTAPLYGAGNSEKHYGRFLPEIDRESFVISSKVGRLILSEEEAKHHYSNEMVTPAIESNLKASSYKNNVVFNFSREGVLRSIEESLKRLNIDNLDIVYIHDPDDNYEIALNETLPTLLELKSKGIIKAIGAGMNEWEMLLDFAKNGEFDCFLLAGRYTLLDYSALDLLLPKCIDKDISIIIGGPYNSGILASDLNDACEKLGIWVEKSMYGKKYFGIDRSTFIIDTNGKILFSWNKVKVKGHVDEVLSVAKSL